MLTLHHFDRSPYGWKVRIVLAEKRVPCRLEIPQDKAHDPAFGALNPFRLTPVLQLPDGRTIYESTVIAEYLEEAYPEPAMLPRDLHERARVRMLEDTADQYVAPALRTLVRARYRWEPPLMIPKPDAELDQDAIARARAAVHDQLARLERELDGRTWFGGEIFSLADAALVPLLTGTIVTAGELPDVRYPNLALWAGRARARPSVREAAPREPMRIAA